MASDETIFGQTYTCYCLIHTFSFNKGRTRESQIFFIFGGIFSKFKKHQVEQKNTNV